MKKLIYINLLLFFLILTVMSDIKAESLLQSTTIQPHQLQTSGKIKAAYMGILSYDVLEKMHQTGMSHALVKVNYVHSPMLPSEKRLITNWANKCNEAGLKLVVAINYWGSGEEKWTTHRFSYFHDLEYKQTPCPLEKTFYETVIHKRLLELAELSKTIPICGVLIDFEMYAANSSHYRAECLCDNCFGAFAEDNKIKEQPKPENRYQYLIKTGQIIKYRAYIRQQAKLMAEKTQREVHKVSPDFIIAAHSIELPGDFYDGLIEGFGSGANPFYIFTGQTFTSGYSQYIQDLQKKIAQKKTNAKVVPGIWQERFPIENLTEQYYFCAKDSAGYWIYTMDMLSGKTEHRIPPFPKESYWKAISEANSELSKLELNPDYNSYLKLRNFQTITKDRDFNNIAVQPTAYITYNPIQTTKNLSLKLRFYNQIIFNARQGDTVTFGIRLREKRNAKKPYLQAAIVTKNSQVLNKITISESNKTEITIKAPYSGTYILAIDSYGNEAMITDSSHPFAIEATNYAHLLAPKQPLYLCSTTQSKTAEIEFWVDSPGESISVQFKDTSGKILGNFDILDKHKVTIPFPEGQQTEIIELNITPRPRTAFEDVRIKVNKGFEKYIAPTPAGLMKAAKGKS